ncbi:MAG TPA: alpha/beta fold hydrolase [Streptosporangiaceae bacterium]|nr:alpha/beta fold hydrolase [Streptosporangiaceae bacterium]
MSTPRSLKMPHRVRSGNVTTERGSFAVLEAQPGHGICERRPALLVPGYTGSKEDFLPVLEPLAAAGRTIVALDLRGQYQSPHAPDRHGYAPAELAADLLAVADAIDPDATGAGTGGGKGGIHLVGHSMGGLIARDAALLPTGRFLSLTLLGSGPGAIAGQRAASLREVLSVLDPQEGRDGDDADELRALIALLWRDRLEPMARDDGTDERIIAFLRERTHRTCPIGLIAMARYLLTCPDRTDELAALARPPSPSRPARLPVMVIYGENDDAWQPAAQDRMARRLGAERACIPGAAHSPAVEAPETTARALTTFWNAAERRRPASPR